MSPPSSADKPPAAAATAESPSGWRFTWEAQSHTTIIRLLLFNPSTKPSAQCRDLKVSFLHQQSLLTVSFLESEAQKETLVRVPVPRVLIDPESPLHFRAFDDHIEVKVALLLPVDHPLVSDFDSILNSEGNRDEFRPLSVDSDLKILSRMEEVHFYCRNCSSKLTKGLRTFKEMPSVNWREAADNWFGNCCCSFGGVSEKLVAEYAKSYSCASGVCLLSTGSVLLSKDDLLECEFPDVQRRQTFERDRNDRAEKFPYSDINLSANAENGASKHLGDVDNLSSSFPSLQIGENKALVSEKTKNCETGCCTRDVLEMDEGNFRLNGKQKEFLDGYLGNGFMVRSSGLSKDIQWVQFLCTRCSSLLGAYPSIEDNVPLDGGVRLFKCYISTCLPSSGSSDGFGNYTLEKMFSNQLLENAEDELSFRTIVRDMQTKSPMLQIVLLNPNSWGCAGNLLAAEPAANLVMCPNIKLLFSALSRGTEFDSRTLDDWVRRNQADEIYMFSSQILELVQVLEVARVQSPPSCRSLQGMFLSSMRR